MGDFGGDSDAFRHRVAGREHEIISREVETPDGPGKKGEELAIVVGGAREPIEETRRDLSIFDFGRHASRRVKERKEVRIGKALGEMVQYALSAAIAGQPVVYERNLQAADASSPDRVCGRE